MIDYFYLLDYRSNTDTDIYMMETEPAAAAYLALEDVKNLQTLESIMRLHICFPQYNVRKCFEALTEKDWNYNDAYDTLEDLNAKEKKDAEARM